MTNELWLVGLGSVFSVIDVIILSYLADLISSIEEFGHRQKPYWNFSYISGTERTIGWIEVTAIGYKGHVLCVACLITVSGGTEF